MADSSKRKEKTALESCLSHAQSDRAKLGTDADGQARGSEVRLEHEPVVNN
jgi:hypothetical protein